MMHTFNSRHYKWIIWDILQSRDVKTDHFQTDVFIYLAILTPHFKIQVFIRQTFISDNLVHNLQNVNEALTLLSRACLFFNFSFVYFFVVVVFFAPLRVCLRIILKATFQMCFTCGGGGTSAASFFAAADAVSSARLTEIAVISSRVINKKYAPADQTVLSLRLVSVEQNELLEREKAVTANQKTFGYTWFRPCQWREKTCPSRCGHPHFYV